MTEGWVPPQEGVPPQGPGWTPPSQPPPGSGAPPPGSGAPPPGYGAPPPGYGAPQQGYPPPQGNPPGFGPPGYGQPGFGPPNYPGAPYGGYPGYAAKPVPVDSLGRPLAEWWKRLLAILLDFVIYVAVAAVFGGIFAATVLANSSTSNGFFLNNNGTFLVGAFVLQLIVAVLVLGYFGLLDGGAKGQTVGKLALGIATRDATTGGPIGWERAVLRRIVIFPNLALSAIPVVGSILAGISFIWVLVCSLSPLWDSRFQGLHDKAAKTVVVCVR